MDQDDVDQDDVDQDDVDQDEVSQREWSHADNWRFGVYNAPLDSRVWVPKQPAWMGWTLNFAHRAAYVWLAVLLLPAVIVMAVSIVASVVTRG